MPQAFAIAALTLAHLFDYASFLMMIARHGLDAEANPIVVSLAQETGLGGLTVAKIASVAFAAALMLVIADRRRRTALLLLTFGIGVGVLGGVSNIATL